MTHNLLRPMALLGALSVMLTLTVTLSRTTLFASGIGTLKCYDMRGAIEKCSVVDQPPLIVRTSVRHRPLN